LPWTEGEKRGTKTYAQIRKGPSDIIGEKKHSMTMMGTSEKRGATEEEKMS
jgi:hypothetical protein